MLRNIVDYHVHTNFSADCDTEVEDLLKRARELELKRLVFTDHVDFDSPSPVFKDDIDYHAYNNFMKKLQEENDDIEILMGVEVGYQPHLNQRIDDLLNRYDFDFVISSIHCWDGVDFYSGDFFKGKGQYQAYYEYFQAVKYSIENYKDFDVFGHLDYIIRYGGYENKELDYEDYKDIIDDILRLLIENGKGIEINTSGIRQGLGVMHPGRDILKRYKDLGGEIITLGSDSHRARDLQANFQDAIDILKSIGYKRIAQFKKRKPIFIDI